MEAIRLLSYRMASQPVPRGGQLVGDAGSESIVKAAPLALNELDDTKDNHKICLNSVGTVGFGAVYLRA